MEQKESNKSQEKINLEIEQKKKDLEISITDYKLKLKKKKLREEYWLFFFQNLDFYTYGELISVVFRIWYMNLIRLWRILFTPFKDGLFLYENIFSSEKIKSKFFRNILILLCMNIIYLSCIFMYDTYIHNYVMDIQLEKALDYFYN